MSLDPNGNMINVFSEFLPSNMLTNLEKTNITHPFLRPVLSASKMGQNLPIIWRGFGS